MGDTIRETANQGQDQSKGTQHTPGRPGTSGQPPIEPGRPQVQDDPGNRQPAPGSTPPGVTERTTTIRESTLQEPVKDSR